MNFKEYANGWYEVSFKAEDLPRLVKIVNEMEKQKIEIAFEKQKENELLEEANLPHHE